MNPWACGMENRRTLIPFLVTIPTIELTSRSAKELQIRTGGGAPDSQSGHLSVETT